MTHCGTNAPLGSRIRPQTLASCGAAGKEILIPRPSLFAGLMGAATSAGWFTAFAIEAAANVRTLGLVELIFSYVVSLKLFREKLSAMELGGMALIALGIVVITLGR